MSSGSAWATATTLEAEQVVIAAGVWSNSLAGVPPEARVPVRPVKGQILSLRDPGGPGLLTRVVRMERSYVVPRGDGRYVLGATVEERGFDTTVTAGAVFELLRDAIELMPGLDELVIDELSVGLRPGTPDNAPAIGPGALERLALGHRALSSRDPADADHRRDRGLVAERRGTLGAGRAIQPAPLRRGADRGMTVVVSVNGERFELPEGATVADVVEPQRRRPAGPRGGRGPGRARWFPEAPGRRPSCTTVTRVEIVAAVQGG